MKDVIIVDDLLEKNKLDTLKNYFVMNQNNLRWLYYKNINYQNPKEGPPILAYPAEIETKKNDGFVIILDQNDVQISKEIYKLIEEIKKYGYTNSEKQIRDTLRVKINLTKPQKLDSEDLNMGIHVDRFIEHITLIFYINTNDGYTILYENDRKTIKHKIDCVENRLVIFNGLTPHVGVPSTKTDKCLINFNFIEKKINTKLI